MKKKILVIFVIVIMLFNIVVFAEEENVNLTIDEAVQIGLENSWDLKTIENEIELSKVSYRKAKGAQKKLDDSDDSIKSAKEVLSGAYNAINNEIAPVDIPVNIPGVGSVTIPAGQNIDTFIQTNLGITGTTKDTLKAGIISGVQSDLSSKESNLSSGENKLDSALAQAGVTISDSLDLNNFDSLSISSTGNLLTTMANIKLGVTKASYDIYKNQIAMLIKKNYLDVLKAKNILDVKEKSLNRAKTQYEFSKLGYEEGMKAKDDMLIADIYYKSKQIEYRKSEGEYNNAMTELKRNIGVGFDKEIVLSDVLDIDVSDENLSEGIILGLNNRIEIRKTLGEVVIYDLNLRDVHKKYPKNTYAYKEAYCMFEKSKINFQNTKLDVENSIRQSYETMNSVEDMLLISKEMVQEAISSLEIAKLKYEEGFGVETSLLKSMNLESSAGTIVEVLAAEENLAQVEESAVEIMYSFNLAKEKYYNDIGKFNY